MELPWEYFMAQGGFFFPVWEKCCVLTKVLCSLRCQPRAYLTCNAQHFFGQMVKNVISLKRSLNSLNIGLIYLNMVQISLNMALISLRKRLKSLPNPPQDHTPAFIIHNHPSAANRTEPAREREHRSDPKIPEHHGKVSPVLPCSVPAPLIQVKVGRGSRQRENAPLSILPTQAQEIRCRIPFPREVCRLCVNTWNSGLLGAT